jgi:hypothetical protein
VADLNGDGIPDIVAANSSSTTVSVLLGNGDGTFKTQKTFSGGNGPYYITSGDVNGDGIPDLITAVTFYNTVDILLGNGDGTFKSPIQSLTSGSPNSLTITDVNGDGKPDVVTADTTRPGGVGALLGNGNGTFQSEVLTDSYSYTSVLAASDMNGDGRPDLLGNGGPRITASGSILLGNGSGNFTGQTYTIIAVADTINGTPGVDAITLVQDIDGTDIDWTMGALSGKLPINDPNGLTINGNGGADTITLDYTHGNPLPNFLHLDSSPSTGGTFTISSFAGSGDPLLGTTLDIGKSKVFLDYSTGPDPIGFVRNWLVNGYNGGAWNGVGDAVMSKPAQTNNGYMIGYADSSDGVVPGQPANTVELMYTLGGDLNLQGTVVFSDFAVVVANYGKPAVGDTGAITYGTTVSFADFALTVANYGKQANLSAIAAVSASAKTTTAQSTSQQVSPTANASSEPVVTSSTQETNTAKKRSMRHH